MRPLSFEIGIEIIVQILIMYQYLFSIGVVPLNVSTGSGNSATPLLYDFPFLQREKARPASQDRLFSIIE
jgi:hypothetical protein